MSQSSLAKQSSPFGNSKSSSRNGQKITKITIHHMAGICGAKECAEYHRTSDVEASANYYIGNDGAICSGVPEERRAWTSSNRWNDEQAITIEVSNSSGAPNWDISNAAYNSLIDLCADICKRYSITPHYDGTRNATLTLHSFYAATACPGPFLTSLIKSGKVEKDIRAKLAPAQPQSAPAQPLYRVQVGAFSKRENAEKLAKELTAKGYSCIIKM